MFWLLLPQIERDEFLRTFQSYINRFRSPYEQSYSQDPLYYSLNVGRAPNLQTFNPSACMPPLLSP